MDSIGWIGLGSMGAAMAKNMQRHLGTSKLQPLRIYNRTVSRMQPVIALGAKGCDSVMQVVNESNLIFISVGFRTTSEDVAVKGIIEQILQAGDIYDKIVVDTTTVHPDTTKAMAAKLKSKGAMMVAAPCFGATPVAEQGKLLLAVAGPKPAADLVASLVDGVLAREVIRVSEEPEKATLLKTSGNFIIAGIMELIAEAMVFADKTGLGVEVLQKLIELNFGSLAYSDSKRMTDGIYMPGKDEAPYSGLDLALKDVGHGISCAENAGTELKVGELILSHLKRAKIYSEEHGDRPLDSSSLYGVIRQDAGLDFRTDFVKQRDAEHE